MVKNKPIILFITILMAIVAIAIGIVVLVYNQNKPMVPNVNYTDELSVSAMSKLKEQYSNDEKKEEFLSLCEEIELAVANKLLDGSVTNDEELTSQITKINGMFLTKDWTYLGLEFPTYWMGTWSLDASGILKFSFNSEELKPSWVTDKDIVKYIK